jgi:hypothetical protein
VFASSSGMSSYSRVGVAWNSYAFPTLSLRRAITMLQNGRAAAAPPTCVSASKSVTRDPSRNLSREIRYPRVASRESLLHTALSWFRG